MTTLVVYNQNVIVGKEPFEGYTHRFKIEFEIEGQEWTDNIDLYANTASKEVMVGVVEQLKGAIVKDFRVIHVASKEQDEASARLIEETLKDI